MQIHLAGTDPIAGHEPRNWGVEELSRQADMGGKGGKGETDRLRGWLNLGACPGQQEEEKAALLALLFFL